MTKHMIFGKRYCLNDYQTPLFSRNGTVGHKKNESKLGGNAKNHTFAADL
jgi:hypothetical protein